ncbi:MAG: hypothetical protein ACFFC9_09390 [Promethearchaeota archaeon]
MKNKVGKISKIIEELIELLDFEEYVISVTYILSILAENNVNYIPDEIISKLETHLDSDNNKVKTNCLLILGFAMLSSQDYIEKYFKTFIELINDPNSDIKDNVFYFLHEIVSKNHTLIIPYKDLVLEALYKETKEENLLSLLNFFEWFENYNFKDLYQFREFLKGFLLKIKNQTKSPLYLKLVNIIKILFPSFKELEFDEIDPKELSKRLENQVLIKKYDFTEISKKEKIKLKDYIKKLKQSILVDKEIYFYTRVDDKTTTYLYEVEKEKLLNFFNKNQKINITEIMDIIPTFKDSIELSAFLKTLIKLSYIKGYFSELGYYYPYNYLKSEFLEELQNKGIINLRKFDYIPLKIINEIINDISNSTKEDLLLTKSENTYYSLKKIQKQINSEAAKRSSIDLKLFRERLLDRDFIKLIKNLPKEYLTNYHKGTQWITNLGIQNVKKEIENSKIIGFYSISEMSKKLKISKILLVEILEDYIDHRSGVFNREKEIFYYSKFLNAKIDEINLIPEIEKRNGQIKLLAEELDIDSYHILSKIDENLKKIGEEIMREDQININDYLEKTGMTTPAFLEFITELGLNYFKKGSFLIFNESKINDAKREIKQMLIEKANSENYLELGDLETTSNLIKVLLKELQDEEKIKGIFHYDDDGKIKFYTKKGIENLMLDDSHLFSFYDFFYGKELNSGEIEILLSIFKELVAKNRLKGTFDAETLTFSSHEVLFAQDYNSVLNEFEKMVNRYNLSFNIEFQKIKKILTKKDETIFPQEIKIIQELIDRINEKYIRWRNELEAFIRKANVQLLKRQGYSLKRYKSMQFSADNRDEIKLFEKDPKVIELLDEFNLWIKMFNELEIKYGNIIFYQKRLIRNPDSEEDQNKFNELIRQLKLN